MNKKFKFVTASILGDVEENLIKFIGDYSNLNEKEFLDRFKMMFLSKNFTLHVEIMVRNPNIIILQTSKYNYQTKEFSDHLLWIFDHIGPNKYDWTLNRFRS